VTSTSTWRCPPSFYMVSPMLSGCCDAVVMTLSSFGESIIFRRMTCSLQPNTPSSLQSQRDPSTGADERICRRQRPMSMDHRVSTPNKHSVNQLYVHQKYGIETKGTNGIGCYHQRIPPSTPVMDCHGGRRPRELGVLG
jgi:hypothetical protein